MKMRARVVGFAAAVTLALACGGCFLGPAATGEFDRTLSVSGPVHLELHTGAGSVEVHSGGAGTVRIHAEVRVRSFFGEDPDHRLKEITDQPPVSQSGDVIRIGYEQAHLENVAISYTIETPETTDLQAGTGAGHVDIRGLAGTLDVTTGAGSVLIRDIRGDVTAHTGTGSIQLDSIHGSLRASTGAGTITAGEITGELRITTGAGSVTVRDSSGRISAHTGTGSVNVTRASADLRAETGMGHINVSGNPSAGSYWDLRSGVGSITLDVPSDASFRLNAHADSGRIDTQLPLVLEEGLGRHDVRGRIGSGAARVEVQTGAGTIHIL